MTPAGQTQKPLPVQLVSDSDSDTPSHLNGKSNRARKDNFFTAKETIPMNGHHRV
jgi:hypothetical protein